MSTMIFLQFFVGMMLGHLTMAMRLTIIFHWMNWPAGYLMMQQKQQRCYFVLGVHLQIECLRMTLVGHL